MKNNNEKIDEKKKEVLRGKMLHPINIKRVIDQFLTDLKSYWERVDFEIFVKKIPISEIKEFCIKNEDVRALEKMMIHEIPNEPSEEVIVIGKTNGDKLKEEKLEELFSVLGFNTNVIISKNHGSDGTAATNVNGYIIPGWRRLMDIINKKGYTNMARFFGRKFAPGVSRLHVRTFEGNKYWYLISHIDRFNWFNLNIKGVLYSHGESGKGDYKNGTRMMYEILTNYVKGIS